MVLWLLYQAKKNDIVSVQTTKIDLLALYLCNSYKGSFKDNLRQYCFYLAPNFDSSEYIFVFAIIVNTNEFKFDCINLQQMPPPFNFSIIYCLSSNRISICSHIASEKRGSGVCDKITVVWHFWRAFVYDLCRWRWCP